MWTLKCNANILGQLDRKPGGYLLWTTVEFTVAKFLWNLELSFILNGYFNEAEFFETFSPTLYVTKSL